MSAVFEKLRLQLEKEEWPSIYMFKFIIPNDPEKIAKVSALFDDGVELRMQPSTSKTYVSITGKELMIDADSVIDRYVKAAEIDGLIAL